MKPARARILELVLAEPGEYTAADIASETGLTSLETRRNLKALVRAGLVSRGRWRLHTHSRAGIVKPWTPSLHARIFAALRLGPCTGGDLVQRLGMSTFTGKLGEALEHLVACGDIAPPAAKWPTEKAKERVR